MQQHNTAPSAASPLTTRIWATGSASTALRRSPVAGRPPLGLRQRLAHRQCLRRSGPPAPLRMAAHDLAGRAGRQLPHGRLGRCQRRRHRPARGIPQAARLRHRAHRPPRLRPRLHRATRQPRRPHPRDDRLWPHLRRAGRACGKAGRQDRHGPSAPHRRRLLLLPARNRRLPLLGQHRCRRHEHLRGRFRHRRVAACRRA